MYIITKCFPGYITMQNLFSVALKSNYTTKFTALHKAVQRSAQRAVQ